MTWDDRLADLFEDLEQQAEGLHLAERDAELVDRSRSEYAGVTLAGRLHASAGATVTLSVTGVGPLEGRLARVGVDWCLLETSPAGQEWVVAMAAVKQASGLSERAVNEVARTVVGRLPLRSALRGLADSRSDVLLHHVDGTRLRGRLARAGADFVEVVPQLDDVPARARPVEVVPLSTLAAVRRT